MKVLVAEKPEKLQVWHERLGHQNKQYVEKYLRKHKINYIKDDEFGEGCVLGKHHRKSFGTRPIVATKPGDLIHADVCGPMDHAPMLLFIVYSRLIRHFCFYYFYA